VYVPDGDGPFPVVVSPVGHWEDGKSSPTPAARSHALAKLGYLSLTWDPFGLGEREVVGNAHDEHWRLVLTGHTNAGLYAWETMRAMDYVLSRPDADSGRVAMTGESGGGLATVYTSPLESRHQVVVPVAYVTEYEDFIATGKWHCGCSHIPGLGGFTDMGEIVGLFVPRPTLLLNALWDNLFPPIGAQRAEAQARPIYELYGAGDRLRLELQDGWHGYPKSMRESMYGWVEYYLNGLGDGSPVAEPTFAPLPVDDPAVTCFPGGIVPDSYRTVRDLAWAWASQASAALAAPEGMDPACVRAGLAELLNPPPATAPTVEIVGVSAIDGLEIERVRIEPTDGIALPGRLLRAPAGSAALVVVDGSRERLLGWSALRAAHAAGFTVLHVSLRGQVETEWAEYQTVAGDMLLDDPLLGQRALDIVQSVRALRSLLGGSSVKVGLIAADPVAAPSALAAQALWGEIDALALGPMFGSWLGAFERDDFPMTAYVSRILLELDVPQLVALAADHPLRIAFDDDGLPTHYPDWSEWIEQHADVEAAFGVEQALPWIAEQLGP
jgi:hypothetical protein